MVRYYEFSEKEQTVSAQLTWSHYNELLPIDNISEVNYYVQLSIKNNLSVRQLKERIKNKKSNEFFTRFGISVASVDKIITISNFHNII